MHLQQSTGSFSLFEDGGAHIPQGPQCLNLLYLDCSPDIASSEAKVSGPSRDRSDSAQFLQNPHNFVSHRYDGSVDPRWDGFSSHFREHALPDYFVLFSIHQAQLVQFLQVHDFEEVASVFHSHVPGDQEDSDHSERIHVYHRKRRH